MQLVNITLTSITLSHFHYSKAAQTLEQKVTNFCFWKEIKLNSFSGDGFLRLLLASTLETSEHTKRNFQPKMWTSILIVLASLLLHPSSINLMAIQDQEEGHQIYFKLPPIVFLHKIINNGFTRRTFGKYMFPYLPIFFRTGYQR